MRDRLIELLKETDKIRQEHNRTKDCYEFMCDETDCYTCDCGKRADYLLANGVIVPPCKVGDKVWDNDFGRACSYIVTGFDIGKTLDDEEKHKELFMYYENSNGSVRCNCPVSQMGKTVFLTKEEAEQALGKLQASYKQVKGGEE